MKNLTQSIGALLVILLVTTQVSFAFQPKETARYFNGPTVSAVEATSARLSLSAAVLADLTDEEKQNIYFQYGETHQVCIMIYPTPEHCLPKKTPAGKTDVVIANLKPNTSYTAVYKRDNTIRCITTPCPGNDFESLSVEFVTKPAVVMIPKPTQPTITRNLGFGSRGEQVTRLQTILIEQGYLRGQATGYFGVLTLKAVYGFQRAHNIVATGFVGPLTRAAISSLATTSPVGETFEGTITAYSLACFADGECSISVDGKKIVTTIGWSQQIVGSVTGIPDFGSVENKVGSRAKVFAKKTATGYTLYGSADYYIQIQ